MTSAGNSQNNPLCDKLRAKFAVRGINSTIVKEKTLSYKQKKAQKAKVRANAAAKATTPVRTIMPGFTSAKKRMPGKKYRRHFSDSFEGTENGFIPDGGRFGYAFAKGTNIRNYAENFDYRRYEARHPKARYERIRPVSDTKADRNREKDIKRKSIIERIASRKTHTDGERRVKSSPIPKAFVASLILCTALLMVVIYTYASYSEICSEGKKLQSEKNELLLEHEKLSNLLEVRDDIREIEDYAINKIGMVKSDVVETRYVSVAGGERIEVIRSDDGDEKDGGVFSNFLSAMGGNLERIKDHID